MESSSRTDRPAGRPGAGEPRPLDPEGHPLDTGRANVLRPLLLEPGTRVLLVDGGPAVAEHLASRTEALEVLTADPQAADAVRAGLGPTAHVTVGSLDGPGTADGPTEGATYDLVVALDVADDARDADHLHALVEALAARTSPTGTLVLAATNALAVRHLAGGSDDRTGRPFDPLEGYPHEAARPSLTRAVLERAVRAAGLEPELRAVFPRHREARAVLDVDGLAKVDTTLTHRIPAFPSPDLHGPQPRLADERLLWRGLVDAGLALDTTNALLVLAARPGAPSVWPAATAAAFYSTGRFPRFATETLLRVTDDGARFARRRLHPELASETATDDHELRVTDVPYLPGRDLVEVLATDDDDERTAALVRAWVDLVRGWAGDGGDGASTAMPLDLVPHNLVVDGDGQVLPFDQEWFADDWSADDVIARGALWLAVALASRTAPERWPDLETVGDLARHVGRLSGLDPIGHWVTPAVQREAAFQVAVQQRPAVVSEQEARAEHELRLLATLGTPLELAGLGPRDPELRRRAEARVAELEPRLEAAEAAVAELRLREELTAVHVATIEARVADQAAELAVLRGRLGLRVDSAVRRVIDRAAPEGTGRRAVVGATGDVGRSAVSAAGEAARRARRAMGGGR